MDLMKELYGSAEPTVEPKSMPKVEPKPVPKVEPKADPKLEPDPKVQPFDNEKLQRLEQELDQAERDYKDSVWVLMRAKQQYYLLRNGYDRDPENSSKEVVYKASANVADCQARQEAIDRKRNSLKKRIAELKGGANSQ